MELATALHHSAQPAGPVVAGPREVEEQDKNESSRRQKAPPPRAHPGVLKEPEVQGGAVTVGYVAAPLPLLEVSSMAGGDSVDGASLRFLLGIILEEKMKGEEWSAPRLPRPRGRGKRRKKRRLPRGVRIRRCGQGSRSVFPLVVDRPEMPRIMAGMYQMDSSSLVVVHGSGMCKAGIMVTMHLALCFFLSSGPRCSASWPVRTRRTVARGVQVFGSHMFGAVA